MTLDKLIGVDDACEVLHLKRKRVTQLLREGQLPGRQISGVWIMYGPAIGRIAKHRKKWHKQPRLS